jgi:hypothetical protein
MMTDQNTPEALIPIWEQHRNRILSYGYALHGLLPNGTPPVTLHGRDMRADDEGVGFHFQYTLTDELYDGGVVSACFAVQIELVWTEPVSVRIDAVPLLEHGDGHYEMIGRRYTSIPVDDHRRQWLLFAYSLRGSATEFFNLVRAGEPIDDKLDGFTRPEHQHR